MALRLNAHNGEQVMEAESRREQASEAVLRYFEQTKRGESLPAVTLKDREVRLLERVLGVIEPRPGVKRITRNGYVASVGSAAHRGFDAMAELGLVFLFTVPGGVLAVASDLGVVSMVTALRGLAPTLG